MYKILIMVTNENNLSTEIVEFNSINDANSAYNRLIANNYRTVNVLAIKLY